MAKTSKYLAEKVCAGARFFRPGDELELTEAEAKPYLEAGAIRKVETEEKPAKKPEPDKK